MENSIEDYKKISDSVKSYSDTELDLIKRGLVDSKKSKTRPFKDQYFMFKFYVYLIGEIRYHQSLEHK